VLIVTVWRPPTWRPVMRAIAGPGRVRSAGRRIVLKDSGEPARRTPVRLAQARGAWVSQSSDALPPFRLCYFSALRASDQQFLTIPKLSDSQPPSGRPHQAPAGSRSRG
jgi:hypothetical protein